MKRQAPNASTYLSEAIADRLADVLLAAVQRDRAQQSGTVPLGECTVDANNATETNDYGLRALSDGRKRGQRKSGEKTSEVGSESN